jgi:hypothetical protein
VVSRRGPRPVTPCDDSTWRALLQAPLQCVLNSTETAARILYKQRGARFHGSRCELSIWLACPGAGDSGSDRAQKKKNCEEKARRGRTAGAKSSSLQTERALVMQRGDVSCVVLHVSKRSLSHAAR